MRIKPAILQRIAKETVKEHASKDPGILAAYLYGSVVGDNSIIGGTADIDLVFITTNKNDTSRDIVRLTDEIHLDIVYHTEEMYREARTLRNDPRLGPTVFGANILYDPRHFMDFTQASVRGLFHQPEYVLQRAKILAQNARDIWYNFYLNQPKGDVSDVSLYLSAVENAANAIVSIYGSPLPERRLLPEFAPFAGFIGEPRLVAGMMGLLGSQQLDESDLDTMLVEWEAAYDELVMDKSPPGLHAHRKHYYYSALKTQRESIAPMTCLYLLFYTWTEIVKHLPKKHAAKTIWVDAMEKAGFHGTDFLNKVEALDAYLDQVEELIERWGNKQGV